MPSKNNNATKKSNTDDVKQSKVKSVKKVTDESDEELEVETKTTKVGKAKKVEKHSEEESEGESEGESEEESEEESEGESEGESEEESDKKPKEKKTKESFEELTKKLDVIYANIKEVEKEIKELDKQTEFKEKVRRDHERQLSSIYKILYKTHVDEVNKAIKSKPKRKGNVNGGFNKEHPVPEVLCNFLGLDKSTCLPRPKVMSALNNKFSELKLKNGQTTTLDKSTAKALGLGKEGDGKEIKFTEFQSFLATFYPKKEKEA
jgi:hypothetical protein